MISLVKDWKSIEFEMIVGLYDSVGWKSYTNHPDDLKKAFENSSFVVMAIEDGKLSGLARSISDDVSIHYLQDILVRSDCQRRGIGRKLVDEVMKRFSHVRTHMLLTDKDEKQLGFYKSLKFSNLNDFKNGTMTGFIYMSS